MLNQVNFLMAVPFKYWRQDECFQRQEYQADSILHYMNDKFSKHFILARVQVVSLLRDFESGER